MERSPLAATAAPAARATPTISSTARHFCRAERVEVSPNKDLRTKEQTEKL